MCTIPFFSSPKAFLQCVDQVVKVPGVSLVTPEVERYMGQPVNNQKPCGAAYRL